MIPELTGMEELHCPDCGGPVVFTATPSPENPNNITFEGCRCDRKWQLTKDMIVVGFAGGPLFIYTKAKKV
jgi:hypothetical protein